MKLQSLCCLLIFILVRDAAGDCLMRGLCQQHTENAYGPCANNNHSMFDIIPWKTSDPVYESMMEFCPHLLLGNDTNLCCSPSHAEGMIRQIKQARNILGRCPSCFDNFAKLWCEFTCSPQQSDFLTILERKPLDNKNGFKPDLDGTFEYVNRVEYRISSQFAHGMFNSCKDVSFGGQQALRVMCTSTPCTIYSWLEFIGTQNLEVNIPLSTNFVLYDPTDSTAGQKKYMNVNHTGCDQSARPGWPACSRSECNKEDYGSLIDLQDDGPLTVITCIVRGMKNLSPSVYFILTCTMLFFIMSGYLFASCIKEHEIHLQTQGEPVPNGRIRRTGMWMQQFMESNAREIGQMAGRNPKTHFFIGMSVLLICLPGMIYHEESTNIVDMWSSPKSRARQEESVFNTYFGRPQRYEQVMLLSNREYQSSGSLYGPVFHRDIFEEFFDILNAIKNISAIGRDGRTITLDDVCYRPMGAGYECIIMSPTNYFQGLKKNLDVEVKQETGVPAPEETEDEFDYFAETENKTPGWLGHIEACMNAPMSQKTKFGLSCFGTYGGPSAPNLVFGKNSSTFKAANSVMMTFLVSQRTDAEIERAELWEKEFLNFCKDYREKSTKITFSYSAERSISDEIEKDAKDEIVTIVIALLFLIGYVTFSLGRYFVCENQLCSILVHSRVGLGILSVLINTLSSFCSWGIFSLFGIHPIKNALVVQFFIVTLLGVCRTFVVVKTYAQQRVSMNYMPPDKIPVVVGNVMAVTMPAMVSSSIGCAFSFFIGGFTDLPAIRIFCLYAGLAVLIDVILHCTLFLALFVWDTKRELTGDAEFFIPYKVHDLLGAYLVGRQRATDTYLTQFFKFQIAPFMMSSYTRIITIAFFTLTFIAAIPLSFKVDIGFDQSMAFTEKSYVSTHLRYLDNYMDAGPPVYFTVNGELDWHLPEVQNKFCTLLGCKEASFGHIMNYAVDHTNETSLSGEVYNWIDNYIQWMSRRSTCCQVFVHDPTTFCSTNRNKTALDDKACRSCMDYDDVANSYPKTSLLYHRPSTDMFYRHLRHFLEDTPNSECVFGGRASFKDAISFTARGRIQASTFMTFHKKLRISESTDFVTAMERARKLSDRLEVSIDGSAEVFAYSKIFPFYEQYSTIAPILSSQLIITLVGVFAIMAITMGVDLEGAGCATLCQLSNYFHILALMYFFGIPINALSATNLVMSSGVFIEFSANVLRAFSSSNRETCEERAESAVASIGSIILAGPVVTMAGSTIFLSGAHLQIIRVYFFQLVIFTIVSSAVHALIYLPAMLSICERIFGSRDESEDEQKSRRQQSSTVESNIANVEMGSPMRPALLNSSHLLDPLLKAESDEEKDHENFGADDSRSIISIDRAIMPPSPMSLPSAATEKLYRVSDDQRSL